MDVQMKDVRWVLVVGAALGAVVAARASVTVLARPRGAEYLESAHAQTAQKPPSPAKAQAAAPAKAATPVDPDMVVQNYCVECHYEQNKNNTAGLSFDNFSIATIAQHPDVGERMIRKLR